MHHLLILPTGRHAVNAGAKSNSGQRVKPDFWPMAASLPDKIGAAARPDHRSLEMKGEGWRRKEANEQASPDLLFCKAGEPLRGGLCSARRPASRGPSQPPEPREGARRAGGQRLSLRGNGPDRDVGWGTLTCTDRSPQPQQSPWRGRRRSRTA